MKKKKVFIIGYFGYKTNQLDGQTVKTRNIYDLLCKDYLVSYFDTESLKVNKLNYLKLIIASIVYRNIFYMGGQKNLKYFFPVLRFLSLLLHKRVYYIVIGGWLYDFVRDNNKLYANALKSIKHIFVESKLLKDGLEKIGINKVTVIPNFRLLPSGFKVNLRKEDSDVFKLVYMARIMEEKGIFLIFDFYESYLKNTSNFKKKIIIDFYGPLIEKDKNRFIASINKYSAISYKGVLSPSDIYKALSQYDLLLLPTFYSGEGFPGTIADAYYSGIPVITSNWRQIPEFVDEDKSGFLIDYDERKQQLYEKINFLCNNENKLSEMKHYALNKSKQYSEERAYEIIKSILNF